MAHHPLKFGYKASAEQFGPVLATCGIRRGNECLDRFTSSLL